MVSQTTKSQLQTKFENDVAASLREKFEISNVNAQPILSKIIINIGVGKALENQKLKPEIRDEVFSTLQTITGQRPIMRMARVSVANFKVREGAPSGVMVTVRRDRMWHFLDRLVNLAIPRIRDFRGLKQKSFDSGGNYSMGLTEQAVWPEINAAKISYPHGMHINMVFENSNPEMSKFVLTELGMPFVKAEEQN